MSATSTNNIPDVANTWILYDGECPFCSQYVKMVRLKDAIGPVRLINAREESTEREIVQDQGLDLDEGMVLQYQGQLYHGDQCIHMLGAMTSGSGIFNKLNGWVFKSPRRARIFYPWLRCGRNLVLKMLRRKKITGDRF